MPPPSDPELDRLAALVRGARSVVALTGAGVSVASGIPDFRSPGEGLWEGVDPMEVAHIDAFTEDPARFWAFYAERFATLDGKLPNPAHRALAAMEAHGLLDAVITQNVDMLHARAGTTQLVELHGSVARCRCMFCGEYVPLAAARARILAESDGVPRCETCQRPLKPDVVLFGEMLEVEAIARAQRLCAAADLLLCIGSSLEVHPAAGLPMLTLRAGGRVAILTKGPTPLDSLAAVRCHGELVDDLCALLATLGIDERAPATAAQRGARARQWA